VRPPQLEQALTSLPAIAPQYYWLAQDAQRSALEAAVAQAHAVPEALHDSAGQLDTAVQSLLKTKADEQATMKSLDFLTSGPRLENLAFSFSRELEATLQDKERYRVYLIAYAGALLILLGYLGGKLKAANVDLERRVVERTRELSEALQHLKESEAQLIQSERCHRSDRWWPASRMKSTPRLRTLKTAWAR
jgi:hypothetical protein